MSVGLPKQIDAQRLAASGSHIEGNMACPTNGRFAEAILSCESDIHVSLDFGRRDDGGYGVKGQIRCTVNMLCQRCLDAVSIELDSNVALGIVETESETALLPDNVEPVICGDDPLDLVELVEDELILALPLVPTHEHCEIPAKMMDIPSDEQEQQKRNPFAVLKDLKRD